MAMLELDVQIGKVLCCCYANGHNGTVCDGRGLRGMSTRELQAIHQQEHHGRRVAVEVVRAIKDNVVVRNGVSEALHEQRVCNLSHVERIYPPVASGENVLDH